MGHFGPTTDGNWLFAATIALATTTGVSLVADLWCKLHREHEEADSKKDR
jgi:hypothetical protein